MTSLKSSGFITDIQEDSKYAAKSWTFEYLYHLKPKKSG